MLLGSIPRRALLDLLGGQLGDDARRTEAERRIRMAIETIDKHFQESQERAAEKTPTTSPETQRVAVVAKKKTSFKQMATLPTEPTFPEKKRKVSESSDDRPIEFGAKPKRLSRFTIEPIEAAPPPATLSPAGVKKRRKKKGRRNAVCSTTESAPAEMDDGGCKVHFNQAL
uniref:Uncharacterized protein n=1 Tax=Steinernema glaseri TaxID=37863 RepID=A0A1I8AJ73_9BILA